MEETTQMGMNRTGIKTSPLHSRELIDAAQKSHPTPNGHSAQTQRLQLYRSAERIGSMPPPASMKEAAKATWEAVKGHKATVLMDKLGERLAFERTGCRLYQSLLTKFDANGSWNGGPKRDEIERFLQQEMSHFDLLRQSIEQLGSDPTVVTPAADVAAVASSGVLKVVSDARTDLRESMDAILIAELVDQSSWELLYRLARAMGREDLAERCGKALAQENEHLRTVQRWMLASVSELAQVDLLGQESRVPFS